MFSFDFDGIILTVTKEAIANYVAKEPFFGSQPDSVVAFNLANDLFMTKDVGRGKWVVANVDCTSYRWYNEFGADEAVALEAEKEMYW